MRFVVRRKLLEWGSIYLDRADVPTRIGERHRARLAGSAKAKNHHDDGGHGHQQTRRVAPSVC